MYDGVPIGGYTITETTSIYVNLVAPAPTSTAAPEPVTIPEMRSPDEGGGWLAAATNAAGWGSMIPGPVGAVLGAANAVGEALQGHWGMAALGIGTAALAVVGLGVVGELGRGAAEASRSVRAYEVGTANALKARSINDALDIHHVGQAHPMEQLIVDYNRTTAPAIALPEAEHAMIPTIKGAATMTPRDLLANDIRNLRNFSGAPNSSLQELIRLNKTMYPNAFTK